VGARGWVIRHSSCANDLCIRYGAKSAKRGLGLGKRVLMKCRSPSLFRQLSGLTNDAYLFQHLGAHPGAHSFDLLLALVHVPTITNVALLQISPIDPWHFMVRAAVSDARDPHGVGAATAEFANIELALLAEVLCCTMQRDVLRARVWMAEYIDEEKRSMLVECLEQQELQLAIAFATDTRSRRSLVLHKPQAGQTWFSSTISVAVARRVLIHLAFPVPGYPDKCIIEVVVCQ